MAEVAAGAVVAHEAVTTSVEAGALGAAALAQPTQPLRCSLRQIAVTDGETSPESLARSSHSLTIIAGHAYIWGGLVGLDALAGNELHIFALEEAQAKQPQYQCIPAISRDNEPPPCPRAGHAACALDGKLMVHGGFTDPDTRRPLDQGERIWIYRPDARDWAWSDTAWNAVPARADHALLAWDHKLVVYGGRGRSGRTLDDTWLYDLQKQKWTELGTTNPPKESTTPPNAAVADDKLYVITGSSGLSSSVHVLDLHAKKTWNVVEFPTNPLTPGPSPRVGAGLVPVRTGMGRTYLLFALGEKAKIDPTSTQSDEPELWSKLWALQLPSTSKTPAQAKDATRGAIGVATHEAEWSEVQLKPREESAVAHAGKAHPGPRAYFACAALTGTKVLLWGGVNPRGETEGDGWMIEIDAPGPSSMLPSIWPSTWFGKREA